MKKERLTTIVEVDGHRFIKTLHGSRKTTTARNHPVVAQALNLIDATNRSRQSVANEAGYDRSLFSRWDNGIKPSLVSVDDVLRAIGYRLAIVPLNPTKKDSPR